MVENICLTTRLGLQKFTPTHQTDWEDTKRELGEFLDTNKPQMGEFVIGLCDIYSSDCTCSIKVEKEEEIQNFKSDSVLKKNLINKKGLKVPTAVSRFCILPLILKFKLVLS